MPTMATYELKVTALIKDGTSPGDVTAAGTDFQNLWPAPATAPWGSWPTDFFPWEKSTLQTDTTIEDKSWDILLGSVLAAGSLIAAGSILNGSTVATPTTLGMDTTIVTTTTLVRGTLLKAGTVFVNSNYSVMLWRAGHEPTPKWELGGPDGVQIVGDYEVLTGQAAVGVIRAGALGQQWAMQSAIDDLQWFYQYRKTAWFKKLIADLIRFNTRWATILAEGARIRELKWYCGNGSGP